MAISRRSMLRGTGAAALVLTAGGGGFLLTRKPTAALAAWKMAGKAYPEPRVQALSYAILAPNPHNRQPWLIDLRRDGEILLHCDPDRLLPITDPEGRQIVIGLGCFLELLRMALAEAGYGAVIDAFPDGTGGELGTRPIARVRISKASDIKPDPLFAWVRKRRSNKEPFDTARPVAAEALAAIVKAAGPGLRVRASNDESQVAAFRELTWQAMQREFATPAAMLESVHLMRIGKAEIEANPDGIDLGGPFLETLRLFGLLSRKQLGDPTSAAFQQGLEIYQAITGSAMAHLWLTSNGNDRFTQLAAGRAWIRINLKATELGLGIHPLSQALQEYSEMAPHFKAIHQMTGAVATERVQMLARIGYGPIVDPSPRWAVETRISRT